MGSSLCVQERACLADFHWISKSERLKLKVLIFLYFSFERQQALVQEQLAQLAQRERESAATTGLDELTPALIIEKGKAREEKEKAKILVSDAFWVNTGSVWLYTGSLPLPLLYCAGNPSKLSI